MYQMSKFPFVEWNAQLYNCMISAASGVLCFSGWWIMIDANVIYKGLVDAHKVYHLPGIASTLALLVINCISNDTLRGSMWLERPVCTPRAAKVFLFLGFMIAFGAVIGATFIMINDFLLDDARPNAPGCSIFFQNVFILMSNVLFRFTRVTGDSL